MMNPSQERSARYLKEFNRPLYVGAWFGFMPVEAPKITPSDRELVSEFGESFENAALRAAFLRIYQERNLASLPHPLALSYEFRAGKKHEYVFELSGFDTGSAEALLIRTVLSVLEEEGYRDLSVELNSIGDKDSITAYERELASCVKKHAESIDAETKKLLRNNLFDSFKLLKESEVAAKIPPSIASLTPGSRAHFKDVLEHVEALGTGFRLAPELLGNRHFASETVFRIQGSDGRTLASGTRYSRLSKRAGLKKELPFAFAAVSADLKAPEKVYKELPRSRFSLIHLGPSARMRALPLLELLREHRIGVHHALGYDKIAPQMSAADAVRSPYLLIIGQKEALEDSVTIRNVDSRAQDTIPVAVLPDYLKHIAL